VCKQMRHVVYTFYYGNHTFFIANDGGLALPRWECDLSKASTFILRRFLEVTPMDHVSSLRSLRCLVEPTIRNQKLVSPGEV